MFLGEGLYQVRFGPAHFRRVDQGENLARSHMIANVFLNAEDGTGHSRRETGETGLVISNLPH